MGFQKIVIFQKTVGNITWKHKFLFGNIIRNLEIQLLVGNETA